MAAVVILLEKLVNQTDQIESALERLEAQGDKTNALLEQANETLNKILDATGGEPPSPTDKVLSSIKLIFKGVPPMPPIIPGPVVLTQVGQQVVAEVVGFDQFGQQWSGAFDWSLSNDNEDAATLDSQTGIVTAVANGVANITADVTTAEGVDLTDTESVTVNIAAEEPVLTTIKVVFTNPGAEKKSASKSLPPKRR